LITPHPLPHLFPYTTLFRSRTETDLLGELQVPKNAYYGVQTQRAIANFKISNHKLYQYPIFIKSLAVVKLAAVETNFELGLINEDRKSTRLNSSHVKISYAV